MLPLFSLWTVIMIFGSLRQRSVQNSVEIEGKLDFSSINVILCFTDLRKWRFVCAWDQLHEEHGHLQMCGCKRHGQRPGGCLPLPSKPIKIMLVLTKLLCNKVSDWLIESDHFCVECHHVCWFATKVEITRKTSLNKNIATFNEN